MDYSELIEDLKNLETIAYGYNINGEVLGMDCSDFEQIMVDAADAIAELNQYKELGRLDRLRELVQADREGRCVVLPCKLGNKVYFPLLGRIIKKTVYSIVTFSNSQRIYCDGTSEFFRPENFGKTVFLTRAAAEKALEEMGENENG